MYDDPSGERNLCFCGGVALNSVLNGKLTRQLGFEQTFIPPYPGDDGIAIGCCAYGLYAASSRASPPKPTPPLWTQPLSPYQGPEYTEEEIDEAVANAAPWLEVRMYVIQGGGGGCTRPLS
jgi:carbamoyltransferase